MLRSLSPVRKTLPALAILAVLAGCGEEAKAPEPAAQTTEPLAQTTPGDWTKTLAATPEGGFVMGNPDAPVTLIEYASLTCPHCRDFHMESKEPLNRDYIATGKVKYEFRNFILNGPDYAASLLARCEGAIRFFPLADNFFDKQAQWIEPFGKISEEQQKALNALPQDQQLKALAEAGRLDAWARKLGIPKAKFDQCLSNQTEVAALARVRSEGVQKFQISGTPSFIVNGEKLENAHNWAQVKQRLDAELQ